MRDTSAPQHRAPPLLQVGALFVLERLQSFGYVRDHSDDGLVTAIITTGNIARDGAIISPGGWDFAHYDRNPVVLWQHDDSAMPVARMVDRTIGDSEIVARIQLDMEDPEGQRLHGKIKRGFVNATSVRWLPKETEVRQIGEGKEKRDVLVFLRQEMLETSFVSIPADPGAMILRADGQPFDIDAFRVEPEPVRSAPVSLTRDAILDDLDYLRSALGDYGIEALAGRMSDADRGIALELHNRLGELLAIYQRPNQGAETLRAIETRVADMLERRESRPSAGDLVVAALVKRTGRSEDRIRQEYEL